MTARVQTVRYITGHGSWWGLHPPGQHPAETDPIAELAEVWLRDVTLHVDAEARTEALRKGRRTYQAWAVGEHIEPPDLRGDLERVGVQYNPRGGPPAFTCRGGEVVGAWLVHLDERGRMWAYAPDLRLDPDRP